MVFAAKCALLDGVVVVSTAPRRVYDRLMTKVYAIEGGCLTADICRVKGYLQVGWSSDDVKGRIDKDGAHRVVWEHERGPLASGDTIHHECFNPVCLNVGHMRVLTLLENAKRQGGKDWEGTGVCSRGHSDSGNRVKWPGAKSSHCRSCAREKYHERKN